MFWRQDMKHTRRRDMMKTVCWAIHRHKGTYLTVHRAQFLPSVKSSTAFE